MQKLLMNLLLLSTVTVKAQDLLPIQTDRPDQTETPFLVPEGFFQIESGFNYENTDVTTRTFVYPTILAKYGVNDHFEWRLIFNYGSIEHSGARATGIDPIAVGFKAALWEAKGIIPKASFIGHLNVPFLASKNFRGSFYATNFRFTLQHQITEKFTFSYNLGSEWDGLSAEPTFIYTFSGGYSFSPKLGCYVEVYGFTPQQHFPDHRADGGIMFVPGPDFQIDLSGGLGITPLNNDYYYVSLGFSKRFHK